MTTINTNRVRKICRAWHVVACAVFLASIPSLHAGAPPAAKYKVYTYNGLYGYQRSNGSGWRTGGWIRGYTDRGVISHQELTNGVERAYPNFPVSPPDAERTVLKSDHGVLVVPYDTPTNNWVWNSSLYDTGADGVCGMYCNYEPYNKTLPTDRVSCVATVTVSHTSTHCGCNTCNGVGGQVTCGNGCVDVSINLGSTSTNSALGNIGKLRFFSQTLTNGVASPQFLVHDPSQTLAYLPVTVVTDTNGWISAIISTQYVTRVTNVTDGFSVKVYTNETVAPVSTLTITQPGGGVPLLVVFDSNDLGSWTKQYELTTEEGGHEALSLVEKNPNGTVIRRWITAEWSNTTELVQAEIYRDADNNMLSRRVDTYNLYTDQYGDVVWRKVRTETGFGDNLRVSRWEYDAVGRGVFSVDADGGWRRMVYANTNVGANVIQEIAPWLNAPTNAWTNLVQCQVRNHDYSSVLNPPTVVTNGSIVVTNAATVVNTKVDTFVIAGITNSIRTEIKVRGTNNTLIVSQTNIVEIGAELLVTQIRYDSSGVPAVTTFPDGTIQSNVTVDLTWTNGVFNRRLVRQVTGYTGSANGQKGQKTVTVTDIETKTTVARKSWLIADGTNLLTGSDVVLAVDALKRPTMTVTLRGTNETVYGCCGVVQTVSEEGIITDYSYDVLDRQVATTTAGVTTSNTLDAAGRTIATYRFPQYGTPILVSSNLYDITGELVATVDALGNVTSHTNWVDNVNGWVYRKTTYADGGFVQDQSYRDGQHYQTTGTATHGSRSAYDILSDGTFVRRETRLDDAGNPTAEWTESYTDMGGRTFKTVRNGGVTLSESFHNDKGQLWKQVNADGVVTLYAYDSAGSQETVAIDMDRNDEIDYAGSDRINRTTTGIATNNGIAVQRTISRVWTTEGVDANEIVAISDSAPDGTASWQISYGLTNATTVSVDRFHARRTVTTVAADGTRNVAMSENGLMRTNIFYAADDSVVSTTTVEYDALNRQTRVVDGRGIVTATAYNNAGQVVAVTNACGTTNQQTTTYQHDSMGRQIAVTMPDSTVKYTAYLLTGEVSTNWGSQTYPVAHTYDYAGRKKTMTTWTNFTSNAGAAVTTWNYDPTNGLLVSKIYPNPATGGSGGEGPTYTYTPGGSLSTRTWARGIVTTYSHDNAGQQTAVHYSDGTPTVTNTFDRRGRRIVTSSSADSIAYGFNDVGQVISETHSSGALDGVVLTNTYDSVQRRLSVAAVRAGETLSSSFFGYDQASRIQAVSNASGFSAAYSYLPGVGMVTGIVFSADGVAKMNTVKTYDDLYRLTLIQSATATGVVNSFTYQYNAANQRSQTVMSDGTYWNYIYDYLGQVSNAVRRWASDNTVVFGQDYQYLFDDIGNRVNVSRNAVESEYSVNLLNQYTSRTVPSTVEINGAAAETAYVTVNNIAAERRGEFFSREFAVTNTTSAVWAPVEVVAVLKNAGSNGTDIVSSQSGHVFVAQTPEQFSHDQDGNLATDGRWQYSWDGENRLTAVETRTNVTGMTRVRCEYVYDAQSRRIQKKALTGWTGTSYSTTNASLFVYDGWLLLSELQVSGLNLQVLTNSYTWGLDLSGSLQGAGGIGGLLFSQLNNPATSNATTVFYTYDGNGNVTDLVDANGSIAAHYEYSPFGETLVATGPMAVANPFRFSTKYYDQETGLYYYGLRFYSGALGRWISRDPLDEDVVPYVFVENAPSGMTDLLGLLAQGQKAIVDCRGNQDCVLEEGALPEMKEMPWFNKAEFYVPVSKSLDFTHKNYIESGFVIYGTGSYGDMKWNPLALEKVIKAKEKLPSNQKIIDEKAKLDTKVADIKKKKSWSLEEKMAAIAQAEADYTKAVKSVTQFVLGTAGGLEGQNWGMSFFTDPKMISYYHTHTVPGPASGTDLGCLKAIKNLLLQQKKVNSSDTVWGLYAVPDREEHGMCRESEILMIPSSAEPSPGDVLGNVPGMHSGVFVRY